jgi:hypothetical protein
MICSVLKAYLLFHDIVLDNDYVVNGTRFVCNNSVLVSLN